METITRGVMVGAAAMLSSCSGDGVEGDPGAASCHDCVEFRTVASLDFSDVGTLPSQNGKVALDEDGDRIAFVDRNVPYEILVFDRDGNYTRTVGRRGDGPGEFQNIGALAFGEQGNLWVASERGHRLDVFSPTFQHMHAEQLGMSIQQMRPLRGGMAAIVVEGGQGRVGILTSDGQFEALWEHDVPMGAEFPSGLTALDVDPDGGIWFSEAYDYTVWRVEAGGSAEPFLQEAPEWFEAAYSSDVVEEFAGMISTEGSTILDLHVDPDAGLVWMTSGVPSEDVTAAELRPLFADPGAHAEELTGRLIDHVVEAFSLGSGERITMARLDLPVALGGGDQYRIPDPETVNVTRPVVVRR